MVDNNDKAWRELLDEFEFSDEPIAPPTADPVDTNVFERDPRCICGGFPCKI